ncbi:MAG: CAP domain-containing protein [Myxococcota bacterium]
MRSHRPHSPLIIFALLAMLLAPVSSASAFDPGDRRRLERASQRAHAAHERLLHKAAQHRERIIAQARAIHERTIAESRAAARRLRAQSRAARRRLMEQSRAARRRLARTPRAKRVREVHRRAPTHDGIAFSLEGSISGLDASSEFSVALNVSPDGHPCGHDVEVYEEDAADGRIVVPYIEEAIEDALAESPAMEPEILDALELSVEDEIPEVADLIDTLETLEAHEAVEPEAIEAPEIIIEAPALGDSSAVNGDFERVEWEIMARINAIRADRGLSELTYDPRLQAGAVKHSAEMYRMNYFSHTSPIADHAEFDQRIQREGIKNFQSAGENLVMGPDSADLAERFVDLWMDSPGHRDNILGDDFRFSGVGVYGEGDRVYATQLFSQRVDRAFE